MKSITILIGVFLITFSIYTTTYALDTYNVGYEYLCKAILHNGKLYFASTANSLVCEYDIITQQVLRSWQTPDYFPSQIYIHPDGERLIVVLNKYLGLTTDGAIGVVNLTSGTITIHEYDNLPMLNIDFSPNGDYMYAVSGFGLTQQGKVVKIDCSSWLPTHEAEAGNYPLGITYVAIDSIFTSCTDSEPTFYTSEGGSFPGPPYYNKIKVYTDDPRLAFRYEFTVPDGLNYVKDIGGSMLCSFHLPFDQEGPVICIIDSLNGLVLDELEVSGIAGVLDAAYSPVTGKIYATVVVDAGNYDPETEVPELAYCGHLLVYDPITCNYNLYEDYFDSQVSMINLCEGLLVVNSINSSKLYIETPF